MIATNLGNLDPIHLREGHLQHFLRKLRGKNNVYSCGDLSVYLYGSPKLHKISINCTDCLLRPIVSSLKNYKLTKYLCNLLTPYLYSVTSLRVKNKLSKIQ